jgi:cyclopropane fatty-acyl-phospholipid synthase-like methyltransferase
MASGSEGEAEHQVGIRPFERVERTITDVHEARAQRLVPELGERWLDVGCGPGGATFLAARAEVTGVDLAPVLVETARRDAAEESLELRLDVGEDGWEEVSTLGRRRS